VAAAKVTRALEWVRHALHLGHGVAEKPFLESAAFLEARWRRWGTWPPHKPASNSWPVIKHRICTRTPTEGKLSLQEKLRSKRQAGKLYTREEEKGLGNNGKEIDGNSPVKGLHGVTERFNDEKISLGHLQLPEEIKGDITSWLENTSVEKAAAELRKTPKKEARNS
jgi:hypothetical protein